MQLFDAEHTLNSRSEEYPEIATAWPWRVMFPMSLLSWVLFMVVQALESALPAIFLAPATGGGALACGGGRTPAPDLAKEETFAREREREREIGVKRLYHSPGEGKRD